MVAYERVANPRQLLQNVTLRTFRAGERPRRIAHNLLDNQSITPH